LYARLVRQKQQLHNSSKKNIKKEYTVSLKKQERTRAQRRLLRVRHKIKTTTTLPRVSVFRSLNHMYAQLIDDAVGKTLASSSSLQLKSSKGDKKSVAQAVGSDLAKKIKALGIQAVVFDRGGYRYHGRVKAVAEGLRAGDIQV
jgi:large subunit ribosomal protein L18